MRALGALLATYAALLLTACTGLAPIGAPAGDPSASAPPVVRGAGHSARGG